MTSEIDEFRTSLVAAVQAELERHASAVVAEVDRVRDESRRERQEMRAEFTGHLKQLSELIDQSNDRADQRVETAKAQIETFKTQFEQRLADADQRQTRRLDDMAAGLEGMVAETAKPVLADLREENDELGRRIEGLDVNLRKFDEQAARMVTYFNETTQQVEARQDELAETIKSDVTGQVDELKRLVDENDATVRRFQNEVGQSVTQKLNDAEDRFNNRLLAAENRIQEEAGQKIADIDVHVSRVSQNLDESLAVMNDRISGLDDRFVEVGRRIDGVEESMEGVDKDSIEELREKMSSAAGEAMLVRIEMERFEKSTNERSDELAIRMTEVETTLQDTVMDVSTAVQLDRLEEIERALVEIDPDQFVRKDGADPTVAKSDDGTGGDYESVENGTKPADASSGPDIGAIIAAAEGRNTDHEQE
jgi:prefoldin subunit 5